MTVRLVQDNDPPLGTSMGWVYVLTNDSLPGWCKVGFTMREPGQQTQELSAEVPGKFKVYAYARCSEPQLVECRAHAALSRWRDENAPEWFKLPADKATLYVADALDMRVRRQLGIRLWPGQLAAWLVGVAVVGCILLAILR